MPLQPFSDHLGFLLAILDPPIKHVHLQEAAPYLRKGSSVIFISSIAGYQPQASMAMYGVTKTALFGLTKVLLVSHSDLHQVFYFCHKNIRSQSG